MDSTSLIGWCFSICMAQDFSIAFYHSAKWQRARAAKIASVFGLCERCHHRGYIVHHKILLTADNINDDNVTLDLNNLEYLCQQCHNREHNGGDVCREEYCFDVNGNFVPKKIPRE